MSSHLEQATLVVSGCYLVVLCSGFAAALAPNTILLPIPQRLLILKLNNNGNMLDQRLHTYMDGSVRLQQALYCLYHTHSSGLLDDINAIAVITPQFVNSMMYMLLRGVASTTTHHGYGCQRKCVSHKVLLIEP